MLAATCATNRWTSAGAPHANAMSARVRTRRRIYGRRGRAGPGGGGPAALSTSAPAFTRIEVAAAGGAPSAMSRSTARRNSTRSASRALGGALYGDEQHGENHDPLPPTVTTELGVPNSSSLAAGAPGSARHSTPLTRNA